MNQTSRFGLCCICNALGGFRTMTLKKWKSLLEAERLKELSHICLDNVRHAHEVLKYCAKNGIAHYRFSSSMFPVFGADASCPTHPNQLPDYIEICKVLQESGEFLRAHRMTFSTHPGQYTVLFTENESIIKNSIFDLEMHGWLHDALGFPKDKSNPINIHPTGCDDNPENFLKVFQRLSDSVQNRLVLENCDKGYWTCEKLYAFWRNFQKFSPQLSLTYDNLHDFCNPSSSNVCWMTLFSETWRETPVFHFSGGKDGAQKRSHLDMPKDFPSFLTKPFIWEVEFKAKEAAVLFLISRACSSIG